MDINCFENTKELVIECYNKLKTLIKQSKNKDETLSKLVNEIDLYRKDFAFTAYKPFVTGLIMLRESYRKELADTEIYEYSLEKITKHVRLMTGEFLDYLEQNDIDPEATIETEEYLPLAKLSQEISVSEIDSEEVVVAEIETAEAETDGVDTETENAEADEFFSIESMKELLDTFTCNITELIAANEAKDKTIRDLVAGAGNADEFLKNSLLRPFKIRLIQFYNSIRDTAADSIESYREFLETVIEKAADILTQAGVQTEGAVLDGFFDPKKHRVMRLIPADGTGAAEGQIAKRYSDCYILNGKVIYPAKADVYK